MANEALIGLIFLPLLGACLAVLPGVWGTRSAVVVGLGSLPLLLAVVTVELLNQGAMFYALGGWDAPLGIRLHLDPLALVMLWMVAIIGGLAAIHAWSDFAPGSDASERFWPLWLLLTAAMNGLFLSADLFNLYVCLELVTLAAIPLIAVADSAAAIRAAMRYLILALLASLAYLAGVALLYNAAGTLDIYLIAGGSLDPVAAKTAVALLSVGLLLKGAVFPLHVWLPNAHASAPGAVSALLSALVVKTAIYLIYRIWLWLLPAEMLQPAGTVLFTLLGGGALIYGGILALVQERLKLVIAYSTVAQIGYLVCLLPLANPTGWQALNYQMLSHGLAKAAMFLAAANILHALGSDCLRDLERLDQRLPWSLFALALAGVSIMGLPPSGGFLAKWLLLESAWYDQRWGLLVLLVAGSLLAAAYVFRILAATLRREDPREQDVAMAPGHATPWSQSASALLLALLALAAGFGAAPILALIETGLPPAWGVR